MPATVPGCHSRGNGDKRVSIIDSKTITREGHDFLVELYPDHDITPFDADCYSEADISAWRDDLWMYAGVSVTLLGSDGARTWFADDLWGVKLSTGHAFNGGTEDEKYVSFDVLIDEYPVPDMVSGLLSQKAEADETDDAEQFALYP